MDYVTTSFWIVAGLVIYVYGGYPLLLALVAALGGARPAFRGDSAPAVTLLISAFNEADVIARKIENSLGLDYPGDRLQIIVISDASDDGTDDIATSYAGRGVELLRMPERGGKTLGLNAAMERATGDVVVFSDANALYRSDAIRALVRHFADERVGAVVGESTYEASDAGADRSESSYWRYETAIKRLETRVGSVVGGDGAIYAIRKACYRPMAADALSDFVNPLQIVRQGLRCVYDPEALSVEEAAGSFSGEFRRKVRIVNRAWRGMLSMRTLLNPFRYGFFAVELISHKLLRWLMPFFLLIAFVLNLVLFGVHPVYQGTLAAQLVFYSLAAIGPLLGKRRNLPALVYVPFYFCLVNIASAKGILQAHRGKTYTTWSTARADR